MYLYYIGNNFKEFWSKFLLLGQFPLYPYKNMRCIMQILACDVTQLYHYCPIESQNAICVYAHTTKLEVVLKTLVGILFWKPKIYIED